VSAAKRRPFSTAVTRPGVLNSLSSVLSSGGQLLGTNRSVSSLDTNCLGTVPSHLGIGNLADNDRHYRFSSRSSPSRHWQPAISNACMAVYGRTLYPANVPAATALTHLYMASSWRFILPILCGNPAGGCRLALGFRIRASHDRAAIYLIADPSCSAASGDRLPITESHRVL